MPPGGGIVLLPFLTADMSCGQPGSPPDDQLTVARADGSDPTSPPDAKVSDLDAWQTSVASVATFRLAGGIEVSATGADAAQVLATFTASGAHRALQDGPLADTSDWKAVTFDDVSLLVPARISLSSIWPIRTRLRASSLIPAHTTDAGSTPASRVPWSARPTRTSPSAAR